MLAHSLSIYLKLLDYPDKTRKLHLKPTPYTGGIAILIINIFLIKLNIYDTEIKNLIIFSSTIVLLGFLDDKYTLEVLTRVLFQIASIFLVVNQGFLISNLGQIFSIHALTLGTFSILFTIICVAIVINAFNYIDGIDGLAASLFVNSIFVTAIFVYLEHNYIENVTQMLFIISIPVIVFFLFNVSFLRLPKLFLGDNGSLLLGFTLSFLLIYLCQNKELIASGLIIWVVGLVFFDFFSTNILRIIKKKSIFVGGQDHLHYFLNEKIGFAKTIIFMNILNVLLSSYGYFIWKLYGDLFSIINFTIFAFIYLFILNKIAIKKYPRVLKKF
jgi:UDP-GlcNAc:undecaprenyl-phosphate GlcNAc-1-phosphate transferase